MSLKWVGMVLLAALAAFSSPAAASPQYGTRGWSLENGKDCMDVPGGNFSPGVQLILYPCQTSDNQKFVLEADGHLVANAGRPGPRGKMCVEAVDRKIVLQPCRRLTTGDRQWWERDLFGFLKNNSPLIECLGQDQRRDGYPRLVVRPCHTHNQNGIYNTWYPYPFSETDRKRDEAAAAIARSTHRVPNEPPTYDPEVRSRFEDNVSAYGPYLAFKDRRTDYCIVPSALLSRLILSHCGRVSRTFQRDSLGRLREVAGSGRSLGVSGRCLQAAAQEGGVPTLAPCGVTGLQRWWVHDFGQIQSQSAAAGNRCLDVKGDSRQLGASVIMWRCDNRRPGNQAFELKTESTFQTGF